MSFASMSTDMYLPALPTIARLLHATSASIELTFSSFLVGFSAGQLLWGPISDRSGRRIPVAVGVALFVIGSAGCALSGTVWQLMGWRVVQAVGASAGPVLARAMVRDLYGREHSARVLSTLILIMGVAPLVGPLLGGQMLVYASWRGIFWSLVAFGFLTLLLLRALRQRHLERCDGRVVRRWDPLDQGLDHRLRWIAQSRRRAPGSPAFTQRRK